jgi:CheY-like chemotaxis protein
MNFSTDDRRRVLLIDCNSLKRQVRAAVLRSCEVEVHMADTVADAGNLWAKCSYDLVLLAAAEHSEEAELLCGELRKSKPRQRIALLVGAPQYVCEVGRKHTNVLSIQVPSMRKLELGSTPAQRTQWQGTVERLLAAEASISINAAPNC